MPPRLIAEIQPDSRKKLLNAFKKLPGIQKQLIARYFSANITKKDLAAEYGLAYAKTLWHLSRGCHFLKNESNSEYHQFLKLSQLRAVEIVNSRY